MNSFSTRLLLSVAAIAVVSGLIIITTGPLHGLLILTAPWAYGVLIAVYFLPAGISLPLFKTPGVGILTAALTGLIVSISPLNARGFMAFVYVVMIGLLQEVPIALTGYKIWRSWVYSIGAILAGASLAIVFHIVFALEEYPPWIQIAQFGLTGLSPLAVTALGWAISRALQRAGIGSQRQQKPGIPRLDHPHDEARHPDTESETN